MNWDALGAIGELVGAAGVIVTLFYLAAQIRTNTKATQSASRLDVARDYRQVMSLNLDVANAKAMRAGLRRYPEIPYEQRVLFATLMANEALFFQGIFAQYETKQLEKETYEAYLDWFTSLIITPGGMKWWEEAGRPVFTRRMVEGVDDRLMQGGLQDIFSMAGYDDEPMQQT